MVALRFNEIWHYLSSTRPSSFILSTAWSVPTPEQPFIRRRLRFYDLSSAGYRVACYETTTKSLDKLISTSPRQPCHDLFPVLMESYTLGYTELELSGVYAVCQHRRLTLSSMLKVLLQCYRQRLTAILNLQTVAPHFIHTFIADTQEELIRALSLEAEYGHLIHQYPVTSDRKSQLVLINLRGQALEAILEKKFLTLRSTARLPGRCFDPPLAPGCQKKPIPWLQRPSHDR